MCEDQYLDTKSGEFQILILTRVFHDKTELYPFSPYLHQTSFGR